MKNSRLSRSLVAMAGLAILIEACDGPQVTVPTPPATETDKILKAYRLVSAARDTLSVLLIRHRLVQVGDETTRFDSAMKLLVEAMRTRVHAGEFLDGINTARTATNYWQEIIPDTLRRVIRAETDLWLRYYGDSLLLLIERGVTDSVFLATVDKWQDNIRRNNPNSKALCLLAASSLSYRYWRENCLPWGRLIFQSRVE